KLHKTLSDSEMRKALTDLTELPHKMELILENSKRIEEISKGLFRQHDFLFLARGIHFPIALEGALKLKELSYIHAEGYPAGEMKHGPNALCAAAAISTSLAISRRVLQWNSRKGHKIHKNFCVFCASLWLHKAYGSRETSQSRTTQSR